MGIPADAPVVVCTARMVKRKGQDTLVKAWPAVLREVPDARLLLVGDGPKRAAVERLTHRLGVQNSVLVTGSVPWHDVPAYTDAALFLIHEPQPADKPRRRPCCSRCWAGACTAGSPSAEHPGAASAAAPGDQGFPRASFPTVVAHANFLLARAPGGAAPSRERPP